MATLPPDGNLHFGPGLLDNVDVSAFLCFFPFSVLVVHLLSFISFLPGRSVDGVQTPESPACCSVWMLFWVMSHIIFDTSN